MAYLDVTLKGNEEVERFFKLRPEFTQRQANHEIARTVKGIGKEYQRSLKKHFVTGKTLAGFYEVIGNLVAEVGNRALTAWWLEVGTKPHLIKVKNAKILAAPAGMVKNLKKINPPGGPLPCFSKDHRFVIFGKMVHHPGTQANAMLYMAYAKWILPGGFGGGFIGRLKERLGGLSGTFTN